MGLYPKAVEAVLAGIPRGRYSNVYCVDPTNGDDDNPGDRWTQPLASVEAAEVKCTANQHDVVLYVGSAAGNNLAAALTWDKNLTHLVGMCAPTHAAQRARIFQTSTLTGASPLLDVTASGCVFKDFYIFQGVDDATSLIDVRVTGGRNYFENVHFAGGGHATQAVNGGASLNLSGAEENLFRHCTIGVDTIEAATGMTGILFDTAAHRNVFEDCLVTMVAGNAGASFMEITGAGGISHYNLMRNCDFLNTGATAMTTALAAPAQSASRFLFVKDCMFYGATKLDANDRGVLMGNMNDVTGADTSGVAVEMVT